MDPTSTSAGGLHVAECRVVAVNPSNYTVDLISDGPNSVSAADVPWMVPYRTSDGGGIDFMPEAGSTCWTLWHESDTLPIIMGFSSQFHRNTNWAAGRRPMNPGDIMLWTKNDNRIVCRKGGNIEIVSTKECRRYYIFARHAIEETCRSWKMTTRGGELDWSVDDKKLSAKEGAPALLKISAKQFAQDAAASVTLQAGQVGTQTDNKPTIFALDIKGKFTMSVNEDGGVVTTIDSNVTTQIGGNHNVRVLGDQLFDVNGDITIQSRSKGLKLICRKGNHVLEAASSKESITGQKQIAAATILLGRTASEPAVKGTQLLQWLASHTHPPTGGPPVTAPTLPMVLSQTVMVE